MCAVVGAWRNTCARTKRCSWNAIIPFTIVQHCCMHWPCWLRTRGGTSSFTKMPISQSGLWAFPAALLHVHLSCWLCEWSAEELRQGLQYTAVTSPPFSSGIKLWNHKSLIITIYFLSLCFCFFFSVLYQFNHWFFDSTYSSTVHSQ